MKNYIIDPSVFYWMNVLSIVQTVLALLGAVILIGSFILVCAYLYNKSNLRESEEPDEDNKYDMYRYQRQIKGYKKDLQFITTLRKWMIVTAVIGITMILTSIFIPSKQTSIEILVAKTATFDNVNWTVQQVKEIIDYIVDALKGAT